MSRYYSAIRIDEDIAEPVHKRAALRQQFEMLMDHMDAEDIDPTTGDFKLDVAPWIVPGTLTQAMVWEPKTKEGRPREPEHVTG